MSRGDGTAQFRDIILMVDEGKRENVGTTLRALVRLGKLKRLNHGLFIRKGTTKKRKKKQKYQKVRTKNGWRMVPVYEK